MVYEVLFQSLLERVEQPMDDIREALHAGICDQTYNTRLIANISNSDHDRLHLQDTSNSVEFLSTLMELGAHEHMVCSTLQFQTGSELFSEVEEVVKQEAFLDSGEPATQTTTVSKWRRSFALGPGAKGLQQWPLRVAAAAHVCCGVCHTFLA